MISLEDMAAKHMDELAECVSDELVILHNKHFNPDTKMTLIVRMPDNPDADFVLSDDDFHEVASAVARTIDRDEGYTQPSSEYRRVTLLVKPDGSYCPLHGDAEITDASADPYPAMRWLNNRFGQAALDAELFNVWIMLAASKPSIVAKAIMNCVTPDEYREALINLASEKFNENQT